MRVVKIFLILIAVTIFGLLTGSPTRAATSTVLINEFAAVTSGTSVDPDWVELYNDLISPVSLDGWTIKDSTETNKVTLAGCIASKGFRKFDFSNRLNNSGDQIRLFDQSAAMVDSVTYFSEDVPAHQKGGSTHQDPSGSNLWKVLITPTPTDTACPTNPSPAISPNVGYLKVSLSEIFPNPEKDASEWVEIYNPNSAAVDLAGWQLVDSAAHFKQLSGSISPKSYRVFNYTSGWLNNSGDAAAILDPSGKGVEKYSFGPSERGFAWAKD